MKKIPLLFCCTVLFIAMTCSAVQANPQAYRVQPGDTLWGISQQHGVSVNAIKSLNGLQSDLILVGQVLALQDPGYTTSVNKEQTQTVQESAPDPSRSGGVIYTVKRGDSLWVIAQQYGVTVDQLRQWNNLTGDLLLVGQQLSVFQNRPALTTEPSRSGDRGRYDIVSEAQRHLGTPYRWGGTSLGGFDCSGFTTYVYRQFNVGLPRTAGGQASYGTPVSRNALVPGDLVFFTCGSNSINHVGIYCGNNQFIHSSSPSSGGVIMSSLNERYYSTRYAGARRVLH